MPAANMFVAVMMIALFISYALQVAFANCHVVSLIVIVMVGVMIRLLITALTALTLIKQTMMKMVLAMSVIIVHSTKIQTSEILIVMVKEMFVIPLLIQIVMAFVMKTIIVPLLIILDKKIQMVMTSAMPVILVL
jgi:hypothetical protein